MDIQASVSVGHENLRTGEAFDKPHPTPEVLLTSTASSCPQRDDRVPLGPTHRRGECQRAYCAADRRGPRRGLLPLHVLGLAGFSGEESVDAARLGSGPGLSAPM